MAVKRRGLGARDLDALLGNMSDVTPTENEGELRTLSVHSIVPGQYQPRHTMDPDRLEELAASIQAQGLIQPVVVRRIGEDRYELIAGERRWRASQKAGLTEVPVIVKDVPEQAVLAMALIENIQREELTPLEEAQALSRLIDEFSLTHQQAADAVGRSRAAVSNLLRLMELPAPIKRLLDERKLDMGHARALLTLSEFRAVQLAHEAVANAWSVRELEEAARKAQITPATEITNKPSAARDPNIESLERELAEKLCTRVNLTHSRNGRGKLVIHYNSLDELEGVLEHLR